MLLEVCVDGLQSAMNAIDGGANRLELCSCLHLGGLTPTIGFVQCVREHCQRQDCSPALYAMIRPRCGPFIYDEADIDVSLRDIVAMKPYVDGFVFGALNKDGSIDAPTCGRIVAAAHPLPMTFHRGLPLPLNLSVSHLLNIVYNLLRQGSVVAAFDLVINWRSSLDEIISLGFCRLLTSGQCPLANQGKSTLAEIVHLAADRIIVMPGSGITEENIVELARATGAVEYHGSFAEPCLLPVTTNGDFVSGPAVQHKITSSAKVAKAIALLNEFNNSR